MRLQELASAIDARLIGDGDIDVVAVRTVDEAGAEELAFAHAPRERRAAFFTRAAAVLVDETFAAENAHELPCAVLAAADAPRALARALWLLHPPADRVVGIDPRAAVPPDAVIGADVFVGPFSVLGACVVGDRCSIFSHAFVGDGVVLGADCVVGVGAVLLGPARVEDGTRIGPGTIIGDEGFVFAPAGADHVRVPHVRGVQIGAMVDVGANACIDRGLLQDTRIGQGSKIDNLAQVGHDVQVGRDVVVVGQVGIAGGAHIGDGAVLAGQAGVNPHVSIAARVRVGGQSGVTSDIREEGAAVTGTPAMPHGLWLKSMARVKRLEELELRVRNLEQAMSAATAAGFPVSTEKK